jgi:hypothetical protein
MANLTVTASAVALARASQSQVVQKPAAVAITAGQPVYEDSNGKWALAIGTGAGTARAFGIAINGATVAGQTVSVATTGALMDLGNALSALAMDAAVYVSDTAGTLADAAGTNSFIVGRVTSAWAATSADKLLLVTAAK